MVSCSSRTRHLSPEPPGWRADKKEIREILSLGDRVSVFTNQEGVGVAVPSCFFLRIIFPTIIRMMRLANPMTMVITSTA